MTAIVTIGLFLRMPIFYIPAVVVLKNKTKQNRTKKNLNQINQTKKHNSTPFRNGKQNSCRKT